MPTREEAVGYARGDITLGFCRGCGFITNVAVKPALHEYSGRYEETQGFSPTFNAFSRRLAEHLASRYQLRGKTVLEIGCGKGEFLALLCELTGSRGVGFDPAFVEARKPGSPGIDVSFVPECFSERQAGLRAHLVICKMTLEHIPDTGHFVRMVRTSVGDQADTVVFFQVPNAARILREVAFWDIYYEHCSYFSPGALARLFRRCGFEVLDLRLAFDEQYVMLEARPVDRGINDSPREIEESVAALAADVARFAATWPARVECWRRRLRRAHRAGRRVALWGGGSKAVAFLTALGNARPNIGCVVDVNPYKHGTYLPGSGHMIAAPSTLRQYRPEMVVVMNRVYCEEIRRDLEALGLAPEMVAV